MRWEVFKEEDDPGGKMVGKWTGVRSCRVKLKPCLPNVPTWHFVGESKIKMEVSGRRNCARCLKAARVCKGGGEWKKCEISKEVRGDWGRELEKFLDGEGWGEKKQRIMEGLEQQLPLLVGQLGKRRRQRLKPGRTKS